MAVPPTKEEDWETVEDINVVMTELNAAVAKEDYRKAAACKKRLDMLTEGGGVTGDWAGGGVPQWLQRRLGDLGMRFPTPIQARTLKEGEFLKEESSMDVLVRAPTGSGKTLAFIVPILAALTEKLEERERRTRVSVSNASLLTPAAAMEALSPALRTTARTSATRLASLAAPRGRPLVLIMAPSRPLAMQIANAVFALVGGNARAAYFPGDKASLFSYEGPKGVRVCALASEVDADRAVEAARRRKAIILEKQQKYEESLKSTVPEDDEAEAQESYENLDPSIRDQAPWGDLLTKVDDLDSEEGTGEIYEFDDLHDCDVLVADSKTLLDAVERAQKNKEDFDTESLFDASEIQFLAVDEADVTGSDAAKVLKLLDIPPTARRVLVGATLRQTDKLGGLLETGRSASVVEPGKADDQRVADEGTFDVRASQSTPLPKGLVHRYITVDDSRRLIVLARTLREDLETWQRQQEELLMKEKNNTSYSIPRPRCVVFCEDEAAASKTAQRLRTALWGDHAVAALLPTIGGAPVESARSFSGGSDSSSNFATFAARNTATVLVTVSQAARGLDFPNVTHVFCLGANYDAPDYVHMAGRSGRLGQMARGLVTTLANEHELQALKNIFQHDFPDSKLIEIQEPKAQQQQLPLVKDEPQNDDDDNKAVRIEDLRNLEDLFTLTDDDDDDDDDDETTTKNDAAA